MGTRRCCDVESTSLTFIQCPNNVVCLVGSRRLYSLLGGMTCDIIWGNSWSVCWQERQVTRSSHSLLRNIVKGIRKDYIHHIVPYKNVIYQSWFITNHSAIGMRADTMSCIERVKSSTCSKSSWRITLTVRGLTLDVRIWRLRSIPALKM